MEDATSCDGSVLVEPFDIGRELVTMKKKVKVIIIIIIVLLVLFFPASRDTLEDGGSKVYSALTYKIVKWVSYDEDHNRSYDTSVYWLPDNFKNINELSKMHREAVSKKNQE